MFKPSWIHKNRKTENKAKHHAETAVQTSSPRPQTLSPARGLNISKQAVMGHEQEWVSECQTIRDRQTDSEAIWTREETPEADCSAKKGRKKVAGRGTRIDRARSLFQCVWRCVLDGADQIAALSPRQLDFLGAPGAVFCQGCVNNPRRWTPSTSQPTACLSAMPTTRAHAAVHKHMARLTCTYCVLSNPAVSFRCYFLHELEMKTCRNS